MLRLDRDRKAFTTLKVVPLPEAGLLERTDIQEMIVRNDELFFREMGEQLKLIGQEVPPDQLVQDRIDLLAIDAKGAVVVIELKRSSHKLHLLQAIAYAGMVSKWTAESLIEQRRRLKERPFEEVEDEIEQFLEEADANLNGSQRIILLAEDFDYEVLIAAEWLSERYGVDIRCYRLSLAVDGPSEYLSCACIFPPAELTQNSIRRRNIGPPRPSKWTDWDKVIAGIEEAPLAEFVRAEIAAGRDNRVRRRLLRYKVDGIYRLFVWVKLKFATVQQKGRFANDVAFWRERLGDKAEIDPIWDGRRLRFWLKTPQDFAAFRVAVDSNLSGKEFSRSIEADDDEAEVEQ